ncbi:MAG: hypothetical protein II293_01110 [Bacteroidaceae bacterium]|nr:hypothetical protein [Bacteroidaceae bacterium]
MNVIVSSFVSVPLLAVAFTSYVPLALNVYALDKDVLLVTLAIDEPLTVKSIFESSVVVTSKVTVVVSDIIVDSSEWLNVIWKPPGFTSMKLSFV